VAGDTKYNFFTYGYLLEWLHSYVLQFELRQLSIDYRLCPWKVNSFVYASICELVAESKIYPFLINVYYNQNLYAKFGTETILVKILHLTGNINNDYFDVYLTG